MTERSSPAPAEQAPSGIGDGLLFNHPEYLATVADDGWVPWRHDHFCDGRLVGSLVGMRHDCVLVSGHRAPFGGPDLIGDHPADVVLGFLAASLDQARRDGIDSMVIRGRPRSYGPNQEVIGYGLLELGFEVECCDLSYAVDLTGLGNWDEYMGQLATSQRTKLRQVRSYPHRFCELTGDDDPGWRLAYDILADNRRVKNRSMSITFEYLRDLHRRFPRALTMTLLCVEDQPCAAALVYRVLAGVDLLVSWGDARHDLRRSPMNLLAAHLTLWSAGRGARLLDLGRATEDGPPNLGLMQFKRSVLGRPEMRINYRWQEP